MMVAKAIYNRIRLMANGLPGKAGNALLCATAAQFGATIVSTGLLAQDVYVQSAPTSFGSGLFEVDTA
jgi:hypothetical protein